jgi:hypothetical protein
LLTADVAGGGSHFGGSSFSVFDTSNSKSETIFFPSSSFFFFQLCYVDRVWTNPRNGPETETKPGWIWWVVEEHSCSGWSISLQKNLH